MSAGVVLSWATEALEKGLITTRETLDVPMQWNNVEGYSRALENIVKAPNEFYQALARGVDYAARKIWRPGFCHGPGEK